MPAYAAQQRRPRVSGSQRPSRPEVGSRNTAPPTELTIQQQFGLAQGIPLSPNSEGTGPRTLFDAARAAMCLLKEEDHVWTIETCMETINLLRARNNELKAQLLEVDINFADHIEARQRKIEELTVAADSAAALKDQLEETLEAERGDRRRQDRDQQRQREADTLAHEEAIKSLTAELESLKGFAGERDHVNAQIAALKAANEELQDQQEIRMQALRKKLADFEAAKDGEIRRLVLEAKENMRDEVEIAFGGAHERVVKENQALRERLKQQDSKVQTLLSELENERAAKARLKMDMDILRALDTRSAGKIKYYMRMMKHSATELAQNCESGGRSTSNSSCKRPVTAPAKTRRGTGGSGSGGGLGARAEGNTGSVSMAHKQPAFANVVSSAEDNRHARLGDRSAVCGCGSDCGSCSACRCGSGGAPKLGRAQTAARARVGVASSADGDYSNKTSNNNTGGCCCAAGGGGAKQHRPTRRAQTAARAREQASASTSPNQSFAMTPPPHPRGLPSRGALEDRDEGNTAALGMAGAAQNGAGGRPRGTGDAAGMSGDGAAGRGIRLRRGRDETSTQETRCTAATARSTDGCRNEWKAEGKQGEREELLAKRRDPPRLANGAERGSDADSGNGGQLAHQPRRAEGSASAAVLEEDTATAGIEDEDLVAADGRAVQCWRDLDAYLELRGGGGDRAGLPGRPATCSGTRRRGPRRPSGEHRADASRPYHHHHQDTGRKRKKREGHGGEDGARAGAEPSYGGRHPGQSSYPLARTRRPWTAAPHLSSGGGGRGEQKWWDRLGGKGGSGDHHRGGGDVHCGREEEARGGKLWGGPHEHREHELFQTLRLIELDGKNGQGRRTDEGLNKSACDLEGKDCRHREQGPSAKIAGAAAGPEADEERLLRAVDNGDPDLLSPGGTHQHQQGSCSSRAARARAALESAGDEMKNRLATSKPLQTVLIRQRLEEVGNGSPTASLSEEVKALAVEKAAKAGANAAAAVASATTAVATAAACETTTTRRAV